MGGTQLVKIVGLNTTDNIQAEVDSSNRLKTYSITGNALIPSAYDYIALSYTGSDITGVVYKTGGAAGTTVATLTITYDGSGNVLTVTRT